MSRTEVQIYKDATIIAADIATDAVETTKIKDKSITKAKLADEIAGSLITPYVFTTRGFTIPI